MMGAGMTTLMVSTNLGAAGSAAVQSSGEPAKPGEPGFVAVVPNLTDYLAGARTAEIPAAIRERARLHVLDTLASIVACHALEASQLGRKYARTMSGGGGSPIFAAEETASPIDAVFANAMTAHAAEINDFIPSAYVQPGPSIVSAGMELARSNARKGHDLVNAVVAGYELAGRIPKAIGTRNLWRAGLANHGVGPVFGTAAASAALLGLDQAQCDHMLAYCAQQASGSWQWMLDVRHIEKAFVFAGMGARNGMQAAVMASLGFTGVPESFDTEQAWFRWPAFSGEGADPARLIDGLGETFELSLAAMKRYPVGGPTQPAVRALLELQEEVDAQDVAAIKVEMPGSADTFRRANMPALNIPYLAAIIMLDGRLDFVDAQSLDRMVNDEAAKAFARKVEVVADATQDMGEGEDRTESARVTITLADGSKKSRYIAYVPGFPTHPMSKAEIETKARELIEPVLGSTKAARLIALCDGLDDLASVDPIVELMQFESPAETSA
ncbi:2-methylcitrate dehydratase [Erythrobacter litoralis]|nr:2-methylcitrate dehydratase [Erythrobacter litoralis]